MKIHGDIFTHYFELLLKQNPRPFFVEVGANDGVTLDHIYPKAVAYKLHGIVIEPQRLEFDQLQKVYFGSQVICLNAAISDQDGVGHMLPTSVDKRGRLCAQLVQGCGDTETITVETLSIHHNLRHIDILCVDTEGMDCLIVKWFLDYMFRPSLIQFEHTQASFLQLAKLKLRLRIYGYRIVQNGMNTIAHRLE